MPKEDYYKILGVDDNANADAIKKAYRKLAKDYHPDKHKGDQNAEARFKAISEAYNVLKDPKKRQQYDQMRRYGFNGSMSGGGYQPGNINFDFSDIFGGFTRSRRRSSRAGDVNFDDFFGFGGLGDIFSQLFDREGGFGQTGSHRIRGQDIQANLELPFETAVFGGKTTFAITKEMQCDRCRGTGAKQGQPPEVCQECRGSGMVSKAQGAFAVNRPCPRCMGKGQFIKHPCSNCNGSGRLRGEKKYSVNIKPGTEDGKKICLRGEGNPGDSGYPAGDLIISLRVGKHKFFRNKGRDIHCEVPINRKRAKNGTRIKVKTVYGNLVVLTIPPNTESGKTFRLKGMGVKTDEGVGDQYVRIKVE